MKITIESTRELARANGLPVRVWTGTSERGTPVVAFVTRLAAADGADASEFARELTEPPTRLVDPSGTTIASPRPCTACMDRGTRVAGRYVARDAAGLEWLECGEHTATDNLAETRRVALEPIAAWFDRHEIPVPAGVEREPRPEAELGPRLPHAVMAAIVDDDRARDGAFVVNAVAGALIAWAHLDALAPSDAVERSAWLTGFRIAAEHAPGAGESLAAKVAELASECRSLRVRLADRHAPWLVKDFHALYSAVEQLSARAALETMGLETLGEIADAREWLELQLARMRPAFEVCEAERLGAPERLTAAEREALDALHRWLHSPAGDCMLIEAAQAYHDQAESSGPSECHRLEAEELRESAISRGIAAHLDGGLAVPDDAELERVVGKALQERASVAPPPVVDLNRIVSAALAYNHEHPAPAASAHHCTPSPALSGSVVRALLDHPRVSGPGLDATGATIFLAHALRGAQMGWHTRHAHPSEIGLVARVGAPLDEPNRAAWLAGYRLAVAPSDAYRDDPAEGETPPAPEVVLTDALREQAKELAYRAPETLTARDRALVAACEADEKARASSPETWLAGGAPGAGGER